MRIEADNVRLLERVVAERTRDLQHRNAELEEARRETLSRLALMAEYRDDATYEHVERVGVAASRVARELGWGEEDVWLLRDAAPLHDVGKLGVSENVLLKRGKLTAPELEHVKRHTDVGAAILSGSSSPVLQLAEQIAHSHHEWWDGSGYPRGLRGEAIPPAARIVALVDVFDTLTHERPYKPAWPLGEAVAEIVRLRGQQFDPNVVDAFLRLDASVLVSLGEHGAHARRLAAAAGA